MMEEKTMTDVKNFDFEKSFSAKLSAEDIVHTVDIAKAIFKESFLDSKVDNIKALSLMGKISSSPEELLNLIVMFTSLIRVCKKDPSKLVLLMKHLPLPSYSSTPVFDGEMYTQEEIQEFIDEIFPDEFEGSMSELLDILKIHPKMNWKLMSVFYLFIIEKFFKS